MEKAKKTILLVEDDFLIALQETAQLEAAGYAVIHSRTGEKAVQIVDADPGLVDQILMDIDLGPGIDGTEAAQRILGTHDIPILFLSSHSEAEIVRKTEEITNYGYVVKSSSFTVLDASIKMAFKLFAANRRLAVSEDKFSKAFQLNPDAININRLSDGVYVEINEGFTRIMGYRREDVLGRSSLPGDLGVWVRAEDRESLIRGLKARGEVDDLEAEFRKKDGSTTLGLMSARVIEIGGERCIISITKDIGRFRKLEAALRESEQKFKSAFERSPIGISLTAPSGRLCMVNDAFCRMLGRSMEEINSMDFAGLTHPDDVERSRDAALGLIEGRMSACRLSKRYIHRDGRAVPAELDISIVRDEEGRPEYFITHVLASD